MAIVFVVQKSHSYLFEKYLTVRRDQKSLKLLLEQHVVAGEYQP